MNLAVPSITGAAYRHSCYALKRGLSMLTVLVAVVFLTVFLAACGGGGGGGGGDLSNNNNNNNGGGGGGVSITTRFTVLPPPAPANDENHDTTEYQANGALGFMGAAMAYRHSYYGQSITVGVAGDSSFSTTDDELQDRVVDGLMYDPDANTWITTDTNTNTNSAAGVTDWARAIGGAKNADPNDNNDAAGGHGVAPSVNLMPIDLSQEGETNWTAAFSHLFTTDIAPDILLLNDWGGRAPYRITGSYDGTTYAADIPHFQAFLGDLDANYAALGVQFSVESAIVVPAGSQGWHSENSVYLCAQNQDEAHHCFLGDSDSNTVQLTVSTGEFIQNFKPNDADIHHLYTLENNFGINDSHGISYLPLYHDNFLNKMINVVAVTVSVDGGVSVTTLARHSNSCGNTKNWCLAAPYDATDTNGQTESAAAYVAGALAVLRGRFPTMPMSVVINLLFASADDLGDEGVDATYGHGLLNLGVIATLQGSVQLVVVEESSDPNVLIPLSFTTDYELTVLVTATDNSEYILTITNAADATVMLSDTSQGYYVITLANSVIMAEGASAFTLSNTTISISFSADFTPIVRNIVSTSLTHSLTDTLTVSTDNHAHQTASFSISVSVVTTIRRSTDSFTLSTDSDIDKVLPEYRDSIVAVTEYMDIVHLSMNIYTVSAITYLDWRGSVTTANSGGNSGGGLSHWQHHSPITSPDLWRQQLQAMGITLPTVSIYHYDGAPVVSNIVHDPSAPDNFSVTIATVTVYADYVTIRIDNVEVTHYLGGYFTLTILPDIRTITTTNNVNRVGLTVRNNRRGQLGYALLPPPNSPANSEGAPIRFDNKPEYINQYGLGNISAHLAYERGYFGQGVSVMVIDSGVDGQHADISSRLSPSGLSANLLSVREVSVYTDVTSSTQQGHGTFVAGVIAARLNGEHIHGVAPDAIIIPADVGNSYYVDVLEYALTTANDKYRPPIINNSWGRNLSYMTVADADGNHSRALIPTTPTLIGFTNTFSLRSDLNQFSVYADGIADDDTVLVFASGNDFWNTETGRVDYCPVTTFNVTTCHNNRRTTTAGYGTIPITTFLDEYSLVHNGITTALATFNLNPNDPSLYPFMPHYHPGEFIGKFVNVVATDSDNKIAYFSNGCGTTRYWCMAAPGVAVRGLASGGTTRSSSGTSFAAPHVSGALAVLKSRFPSMPMSVVLAIIFATTDDLGDEGIDDVYGHGLLNLGRAATVQGSVRLVLHPPPTTPATLSLTNGLAVINNSVITTVDAGTSVAVAVPDFATYAEYTNRGNDVVFNQMGVAEAFNRGYFGQGVTVANIGPLAQGRSNIDEEITTHSRLVRVLSFLSTDDNTNGSIVFEDDTTISNREDNESDARISAPNYAPSYAAVVALGGGIGHDTNTANADTGNVMGVAPSVNFIHAITEVGEDGNRYYGVYRESVLDATRFIATSTATHHDVQIVNNHWIHRADWRFETTTNLADPRWYETMAGVYEGPDADGTVITATLLVHHLPSLKGLLDTGKSHNSSITNLFKIMADRVDYTDKVWVYGADEFANWHADATISACALADANGEDSIGVHVAWAPGCATAHVGSHESNASVSIKIADFIAHFNDNISSEVTIDGTDYSRLFRGYGQLSTLNLTVNSPGLWGLAPVYQPALIGSYVVAVGVSENDGTWTLYDNDSYSSLSGISRSSSSACGIAKNWCLSAPAKFAYHASGVLARTMESNAVAASYVAGALALLRSRHPTQPMSVALAILFDTATDIGELGVDSIFGHGLVNISAAVHLSGKQTLVLYGHNNTVPALVIGDGYAILTPPRAPNGIDHDTSEYRDNPALSRLRAIEAYNRGYYGQGVVVGIAATAAFDITDSELQSRAVDGLRYDSTASPPAWIISPTIANSAAIETDLAKAIGGAKNNNAGHGVAPLAQLMPIELLQNSDTNWSAFSYLLTTDTAPDILLLKDWGGSAPYRITGSYNSTVYTANIPHFQAFLGVLDDGYTALGAQFTVDSAIVVPAGSQGWHSLGGVALVAAGSTVTVDTAEFIRDFKPISTTVDGVTIHHLYTLANNFGADDSHGVSYLPTYHDNFIRKFINVVAVTVSVDGGVSVTTIARHSNSCGNTKNWCLSAPYNTNDNSLQTESAAAHVAGALAVLKSRFPRMPMSVAIALLFYTADDIGEAGVDGLYGRGFVNLGKAATVQGSVQLVVATVATDPNVVISLVVETGSEVTVLVTATDGTPYTLTLANPPNVSLTLHDDKTSGAYTITLANSVIMTMAGGNLTTFTLSSSEVTAAFSANFAPTTFAVVTNEMRPVTGTTNVTNAVTLTAGHTLVVPDNITPTITMSTMTNTMAGTLTISTAADYNKVPDDHKNSIVLITQYASTVLITMDIFTVSAITYRDWRGNETTTPPNSGGSGSSGGGLSSGENSGLIHLLPPLSTPDLFIHQLQAMAITLPVITISNYGGEATIYSDAISVSTTNYIDNIVDVVTIYDGGYFTLVVNEIDHYSGGYVTVTNSDSTITLISISNPEASRTVGLTIGTDESGELSYANLPTANSPAANSDGSTISFSTHEYHNQYGLAKISADIAYQRGYFGQGVTVMVIDTGVDGQHADISSRLATDGLSVAVEGINRRTVQTVTVHTDSDGHGTFVAGIIAAQLNSTHIHGVAPSATIIPANADDDYFEFLLEFAITTTNDKYRAPIINNSWGLVPQYLSVADSDGNRARVLVPTSRYFIEDDIFARADFSYYAQQIADDDTVLVFAAGNEYWNSETGQVDLCSPNTSYEDCSILGGSVISITTFIDDYYFDGIYDFFDDEFDDYPTTTLATLGISPDESQAYALLPHYHDEFIGKFVNVVAVDSNDVIADFSNGCGSTRYWCIAAPGVNVRSLASGIIHQTRRASGTSFAAPHVSGALAVLKSRFPAMPMSVVLAIIFATADDLGDAGIDSVYGHGLLNLAKAATVQGSVRLMLHPPPPTPTTPITLVLPSGGLPVINSSVITTVDAGTSDAVTVTDFATYAEYTNRDNDTAFNQMGVAEAFNRGYFGQGVTVANIGPLAQGRSNFDQEISNRITRVLSFLSDDDDASSVIVFEDDTTISDREEDESDAEIVRAPSSYGVVVALGGGIGDATNTGGDAGNVMGVAPSVNFIHAITEVGKDSFRYYGVYRESVLDATRFIATSTATHHDVQIVNNHWINRADWRFEIEDNLDDPRWYEVMAGVYEGPDASGTTITATLLVHHLPSLKGLLDTGKSHNSSITNLFKVMADNVERSDKVWVYGADEFANWHAGATLSACALADANGKDSIGTQVAWAPSCAIASIASHRSNASVSIKIADFIAHFDDNITTAASLTFDDTDYSRLFRGYGQLSALNLTVNSPGLWGLAPVYQERLLGSYVVAVGVSDNNGAYTLYDNDDYREGDKSSSSACGIAKNWCLSAPAQFSYHANTGSVRTMESNAIAASYVAGALALLRSRHPTQPMSVALAILFDTATDIGELGVDSIFGHGLVNISAALNLSGAQTLVLYGHNDTVPALVLGDGYAILTPPRAPNGIDHNTSEYQANPALSRLHAFEAYDRGYYGQGVVVGIAGTAAFDITDSELQSRAVDGLRFDSTATFPEWIISPTIENSAAIETNLAKTIGGAKNNTYGHGVAPLAQLMPIELGGIPNFIDAFTHLFTANIAPDVLLLKDWKLGGSPPFRLIGSYKGTDYIADVPYFQAFLSFLNEDANYQALGAQLTVDTALVVPAGNYGWNSLGSVYLCGPNQPDTEYCLSGVSDDAIQLTVDTTEFITHFKPGEANIYHLYTLANNFGINDSQGISYLPTYHDNLLGKVINVVAVTVTVEGGATVTTIASHSNSCGNTKNWCISAPHNSNTPTLQTESAAAHVAGALAVLRSRFPRMPMSVAIALLFETADDIGDSGVDNIYGRGFVNLGKAATVQGSVQLVVATVATDPNVVISLVVQTGSEVTVLVTATDGTPYTLTVANPPDVSLTLHDDKTNGHYTLTLANNVIMTMAGGNPVTFTLPSSEVTAAFSANFEPTTFTFITMTSANTVAVTNNPAILTISPHNPKEGHYIPDTVVFMITTGTYTNVINSPDPLTITDINQVPEDQRDNIITVFSQDVTFSITMDIYTVSAITYRDWQGNETTTPPSGSGNSGGGLGLGSGGEGIQPPLTDPDLFIHQLQAMAITLSPSFTITNYLGQSTIYSDAVSVTTIMTNFITVSVQTLYAGYVTLSITATVDMTNYTGGFATAKIISLTITAFSNSEASRSVGLTIGTDENGKLAYANLPTPNSHANSGGNPVNFNTAEYQQQYGLANISAHLAYERGYLGQGVTVMVIDTGVDGQHFDISSQLVAGLGMGVPVEDGPTVVQTGTVHTDADGHGTFVAGIIAAQLNGDAIHGVAPDAKIIPANVEYEYVEISLDFFFITLKITATSYHFDEMLEYALTTDNDAYRPPIINNSWNTTPRYFLVEDKDGNRSRAPIPVLKQLTDNSNYALNRFSDYADGIADDDTVLVFAAGNSYWNTETGRVDLCPVTVTLGSTCRSRRFRTETGYGSVAISTFLEEYSIINESTNTTTTLSTLGWNPNDSSAYSQMPHYQDEFIGKFVNVVATDSDDVIARFSNGCGNTKNWCIAAPGVTIRSLKSTSLNTISTDDDSTDVLNGTSFAAPQVAGALAVLKSRFPSMPMSVVLAILFATATDLGDEGIDDVYGHGLLNLGHAATVQGSVSLALLAAPADSNNGNLSFIVSSSGDDDVLPIDLASASANNIDDVSDIDNNPVHLLINSTATLSPAMHGLQHSLSTLSIAVQYLPGKYYNMPISGLLTTSHLPAQTDTAADNIGEATHHLFTHSTAATDLPIPFTPDINLQIIQDADDHRPLQIAYNGTNLHLSYNLCTTCPTTHSTWDSFGFSQLTGQLSPLSRGSAAPAARGFNSVIAGAARQNNHPPLEGGSNRQRRFGVGSNGAGAGQLSPLSRGSAAPAARGLAGAVIPAKAGIHPSMSASPTRSPAATPHFTTDQEHISAAYYINNIAPIIGNLILIGGIGMGKNINDTPTHHHYGIRYQEYLIIGTSHARFYAEHSQIKEKNNLLGGATFAGALSLIGDTTEQSRLGIATRHNTWAFSADYEYGRGSRRGIDGGLIQSLTYRYQGYRFGMQKDGIFRATDRLRIGIEKHTTIDKGHITVRRGLLDEDDSLHYRTSTTAWHNPSIYSYHLAYGIQLSQDSQIAIGIEHINTRTRKTTTSLSYRLKF